MRFDPGLVEPTCTTSILIRLPAAWEALTKLVTLPCTAPAAIEGRLPGEPAHKLTQVVPWSEDCRMSMMIAEPVGIFALPSLVPTARSHRV